MGHTNLSSITTAGKIEHLSFDESSELLWSTDDFQKILLSFRWLDYGIIKELWSTKAEPIMGQRLSVEHQSDISRLSIQIEA